MKGKKKLFTKLMSALLVTTMTLGLTACGGKQGGNQRQDKSLAKQNVYTLNEFELPDMGDEWNIVGIGQSGDALKMVVQVYNWSSENSNTDLRLVSMSMDGSNVEQIKLDIPGQENTDESVSEEGDSQNGETGNGETGNGDGEMHIFTEGTTEDLDIVEGGDEPIYEGPSSNDYSGYNNFLIQDNAIYGIKYSTHEDYSDPDNYVSESKNSICKWNTQGQFEQEFEMEELNSEGSYVYIMKVLSKKDGGVLLLIGGDEVCKSTMDAEGNFSEKQALSKGTEVLNNYQNMFEGKNGEILVTYYDDTWTNMYMAEYDPETDKLGEAVQIPQSIAWNGNGEMFSGKSHDLIYSTGSGVYGYDLGDEEPVQMMSYINSDVNTSSLSNFNELNETQFVAFYYDNADGTMHGGIFTKVNPE
ncbi:MAG: hypothetical protein K6G30_06620, partial [Acetatifactor sp.]|nr:hypothetical protein [Acetatifactor sp.]